MKQSLLLLAALFAVGLAQAQVTSVTVHPDDMATNILQPVFTPSLWFFYNDETELVDNNLGSFVVGPASAPAGLGGVQMNVSGTQRRNLATRQFGGTRLSSITTMQFSTYSPSAGNGGSANRSAYLHFNVDFNGRSSSFQGRLLFLPSDNGTVQQDTWQTWETIGPDTRWRYSGATWPGTAIAGTTARTWSDILASSPSARMHPGGFLTAFYSWLGFRVGEPYENGFTGYVDRFVFGTASGTTVFDFEPDTTAICADPMTAPSYAGGYVLNSAQNRAFVRVEAPTGGTAFEFYNMNNLVVGLPEASPEGGVLPGVTRSGSTFSFDPGSEPTVAYFPIENDNPNNKSIAFYLRVSDTCGRTVDVDPQFSLGAADQALAGFALASAYPNPTASYAVIGFSLEEAAHVRLSLYDVLGREVARLVDGALAAGEQSVRVDASALPSGVYVYRLESAGRSLTRTFTVAR